MARPEITVCVLTCRRAALIGRLVGSLRDQVREYEPGARLVVDNDSAGVREISHAHPSETRPS